MPEPNQFNSLGEKAKSLNIALKYTRGNMDKAWQMVNGQLNDVIVTKGRFSVGNHTYGIFIFFYNYEHRYIMNVNSLISKSKLIHDKISINDNWKYFYHKFKDFVNLETQPNGDTVSSYDFTNHLLNSLSGYDVYDYILEKNLELATDAITEIISKLFNREVVYCQLEFEQTNSLMIELSGIPVEEPPSSEQQVSVAPSEEENLIKKIESEATHIISGRVIVSPVKGKYINDITVGDRIKVLLNQNDEIAVKVATAQKAVTPEGDLLPVKARIKAKIPLPTGGFILYGVVAKNILTKIIEEENVKIEIDNPTQPVETANSTALPIYIAVALAVFLIALILIILLII